MKTIGIIGNGFVGGAVANGLKAFYDVRIYDIEPDKRTHKYNEVIHSDFVFVCLPTPMLVGGQCNTSIIEDFFNGMRHRKLDGIFIIKSTVPVGTTKKLCEHHPHLKIIHNPEFLTAANANDDFINADRTVLGGKKEWVKLVADLYVKVFPYTPVYTMNSTESECVKYFANCFLASKVMIFNEMKNLCNNLDEELNYDTIVDGIVADNRIGDSHCRVPGPDGKYGFGGTCFPKDINALIHTMEENGIDPLVLKSVWEQNKNYRNHWDWADNNSAVLKEN